MPTPLEDKEAIRELFNEYAFRMDDFRFTELGQLFTEDGEWIAPYSRARGPAEIAALMARNIPAEPRRKHFVMNSLIELDGDRATARTSYLVVLQAAGAGLVPSVAGTYVQLVGRDAGNALLRLSSGEVRMVRADCRATIGAVSNPDQQNINIGKAGRNRWLGRRPSVRGVAMNPIDHPHGGGEGRTSGGRHPVTPWGKPTKGKKTRHNKATDRFIVRRRHAK